MIVTDTSQRPKLDSLDPALLGTWRCLPAKPEADAAPANLVVTRAAREGVYAVEFAADDEAPKPLEAYGSSIAGRTVLNVHGVGPDAGTDAEPWSYARTSFLLADVLRIELVSDDVLKDVEPTSAALRAALASMDDRPGLYVDAMVCVRAKAPDAPAT